MSKVVLIAAASESTSWPALLTLEEKGYTLVKLNSGFEALSAILSKGPDLVIATTALSDLSGFQLAALLKSNRVTASMPVVLVRDESLECSESEYYWEPVTVANKVLDCEEIVANNEILFDCLESIINDFEESETWSKETQGLDWSELPQGRDKSQSFQHVIDKLLTERLVSRLIERLIDQTDMPVQFLESYFIEVGRLLELDCFGMIVTNPSSSWIAFRLQDGLSVESYNQLLEEIVQTCRISSEPSIDRRGDLAEEGGTELKKWDILPITRESNTKAALVFGSYSQEQYDASTQSIIDQLQTQIIPLKNIVMARKEITMLKSQQDFRASIDPLTGLYNLEFLVGFLQQQLLFSCRQRLPVGLAIIDVDHLGQINQDFGFDVGDTVLTTIANRLLSKTRASDLIARYGGDEFAVVLPNTDGTGAKILGEKIRRDIEQHSFPTGTGKKGTKVTVSVGCANFTMDDMNPETILRDAKIALQKAKEAGSNQVAI